MEINDEIYYNELFAEYSSLLSPAQKEIFDMYFGMDLSLGEIAEIKEISRQSVSDALSKAKKQLVSLEEKLGLCRKKKSIYRLIGGLLHKNGVVSVEKTDDEIAYQWGYPNSWAPDNYLAYVAAKACGEEEKAKEIADKYLNTVADAFEKTGRLWEKYDGVHGGVATVNEYDVPEMLGWTAGVFEYFLKGKTEN